MTSEMQDTQWKYFDEGNQRIRAHYGLRKFKGQEPYLSITGEIQEAQDGYWRAQSGGTLHSAIAKYFPELADLIPFHLTFLRAGPMHYEDNAIDLWKRNDLHGFKSTVVFGMTPYDKSDIPTGEASMRAWLKRRKPMLMTAFHKVLRKHGIK